MRMLALMAVTATVGVLAVGANAAAQQTGTLVVRLVTDPAPPGVTWKYSGAGEPYHPLRLEDYLGVTTLRSGVPPHGRLLRTHPTLFSLPAVAGNFYLDISGAEPNSHPSRYRGIERRLRASRPRATVYFHVVRQPAMGRVAIEYWFQYLYNEFYDKHEADWEGVTVFLHGSNPLGVSYSAH